MSRIYLAGRYIRREELARCAEDLRTIGHVVDARWLLGEHQWDGAALEATEAYEQRGEHPNAFRFAVDDVEDLTAADVVISFTETPRDVLTQAEVDRSVEQAGDPVMLTALLNARAAKASRGGRHVEFGMALALGKRLVVVGPQENVFHLLSQVEVYSTWNSALTALATVLA